MFKILHSFMSGHHEYAVRVSRRQAHRHLSRQSDRVLADCGFSRALIDEGVDAWPWREADLAEQPAPQGLSPTLIDHAVQELRAYSDADLADLGISRGSIAEAVRHGRPGFERDGVLRVA